MSEMRSINLEAMNALLALAAAAKKGAMAQGVIEMHCEKITDTFSEQEKELQTVKNMKLAIDLVTDPGSSEEATGPLAQLMAKAMEGPLIDLAEDFIGQARAATRRAPMLERAGHPELAAINRDMAAHYKEWSEGLRKYTAKLSLPQLPNKK